MINKGGFTWPQFPISGGLNFEPFLCNQDIPWTRRPPNPLQDLLWVSSVNKIFQCLIQQFCLTDVFKQSFKMLLPLTLYAFFSFSLCSTHHLPSGLFRLKLSAWVWLELICCASIEVFTWLCYVNCFYCFFAFASTVSKKLYPLEKLFYRAALCFFVTGVAFTYRQPRLLTGL